MTNPFVGRDLLTLKGLSESEIRYLFATAARFEDLIKKNDKKIQLLRGKSVVTLFYENSTRTRTSFEAAGKYMSADVINISGSTSSASKGESLRDTFLTLQALTADCIVMRTPMSGAPDQAAAWVDVPVINAGDGMHEHPTQGLLDAYTIQKSKPDLRGLKIAIVGDVAHSRVARSNIWGLTTLGAKVHLVGPNTLLPRDLSALPVTVHNTLEPGLDGADVVMVLRLQLERMQKAQFPTVREYHNLFGINESTLRFAKADAILMHPGPMNRGLEIGGDIPDHPRSVITQQVTSGVAVRMAALSLLLGLELS